MIESRWLGIAAAVLVAGVGVVGGIALADGIDKSNPPEIKAEQFLNTDLTEVTLASFKGKSPVLIEFWATWCPPCRRSIPHLNEIHEKYKGKGLVVIGLTDEPKSTVEPFMKKIPMNYIVGLQSPSGEAYGVKGIPHAFLLDKTGTVVWSGHPLDPAMAEAIEKAVSAS